MDLRTTEWMNELLNESMNYWINQRMNEWMSTIRSEITTKPNTRHTGGWCIRTTVLNNRLVLLNLIKHRNVNNIGTWLSSCVDSTSNANNSSTVTAVGLSLCPLTNTSRCPELYCRAAARVPQTTEPRFQHVFPLSTGRQLIYITWKREVCL